MQLVKTAKALLLVVLMLSVAALSSCKKDKKVSATPTPTGSVTATIDGEALNFSASTLVLSGSTNGANFTAIQGNASDGTTMTITIYGTLTAGKTYTSNDPDPGNEPILLYASGDDGYLNDITNPSVSVTLTAVSSSSIQGTFSGTVTDISAGANKGKSKVITNGKFNVPREQSK